VSVGRKLRGVLASCAVVRSAPPSVGHWRARARFVANPYSSYSESEYVHLHVVEPLG
jgi:hypothetical protein